MQIALRPAHIGTARTRATCRCSANSLSSGAQVLSFCYSDDIAYDNDPASAGSCFGVTAGSVTPPQKAMTASLDTNIDPLYVEGGLSSTAITKPDDDGPLAYDATKLRDCLLQLVAYDTKTYSTTVPITVIGNSMGGAITRGLLTLWTFGHAPALTGHVTTIFMLEGATEGSWLAGLGEGVQSAFENVPFAGSVLQGVLDKLTSFLELDPSRPGVMDLQPQSQYYWSVVAYPPPSGLNYYAISANLDFDVKVDFLFWNKTITLSNDLGGWPGDGIMEYRQPEPEFSSFGRRIAICSRRRKVQRGPMGGAA